MRVRRPSLALLALVLLALARPAAASAAADPIAVLVRATSGVQVQRAGARPAPAAVGMQLQAGDQVVIPVRGTAVVLHRTGRSQTLTRTTRLAAPTTARRAGVFRQTVRTLAEVAATDARAQPNRQGMIRPIPGTPVPISPRNEIRVASTRPGFTWFRVQGADLYHVQVKRAGTTGMGDRYAAGADTAWTLPRTAAALVSGGSYEWSVEASAGGEEGRAAPPQRFRVATRQENAALAAKLRELRRMGLDPEGDGLFLAAVIYRDAGFFYDAQAALDRLTATGAATGRDFHLLRASVYDALGQLDRAQDDFRTADAIPS